LGPRSLLHFYKHAVRATFLHPGNRVKVGCIQNLARTLVWQEYASSEAKGAYGRILVDKPNNFSRMMYENFSSLSIFSDGLHKHKKIRQLNKLASDYGVDLLSGCKTQTNWWFITSEERKFCNLFGDVQPTRGSCAFNTNNRKIKRDQWGGNCVMAMGCFSSYVTEVGINTAGLGHWAWVRVGGRGKSTWIITAYQLCDRKKKTMGGTVWDQHT
jgi:hypothetical protein